MNISEIITKENITFVIAIFGAVSSAITMIKNAKEKRKNIKIHIIEFTAENEKAIFHLLIENCSHLPISVSKISLVSNKLELSCAISPLIVSESVKISGHKTFSKNRKYSFEFPIKLDSLSAVQGYIAFANCEQTLTDIEKHVTFRVYTNRGNPIQLKAQLYNRMSPAEFS